MLQSDERTSATIGYYDRQAEEFAYDTASADVSGILDEFTSLLPAGAMVLDWGCGTGRDSRIMSDMGFSVVSTDASPAMCRKAKELFDVDVMLRMSRGLRQRQTY